MRSKELCQDDRPLPKRVFWVASAQAGETSKAVGAGRPAPHLSRDRGICRG